MFCSVSASGIYGTETYSYADNGNMTKRGSTSLVYGDASHIHAVTQSVTEPGNTMNYGYDASGNMTDRNGDVLKYADGADGHSRRRQSRIQL